MNNSEIDNWTDTYRCYGSSVKYDYKDDSGFYMIKPDHFMISSNPYIHAYSNESGFFVKIGDHGKLFNPYNLLSVGSERKQSMGRSLWRMKRVTQEVFNDYVNFLRTKNELYIRLAERKLD